MTQNRHLSDNVFTLSLAVNYISVGDLLIVSRVCVQGIRIPIRDVNTINLRRFDGLTSYFDIHINHLNISVELEN